MNMVKTIIADDSSLIREVLKGFLNGIPSVKILGEANNGIELVNLTKSLNPNVLFIDIEMSEMNGIEAAKIIRSFNPGVIIIFITSHDEYSKEAFNLYAYDYILKPLECDRINHTIKRILRIEKYILSSTPSSSSVKCPKANSKLLIESDGKSNLINIQDIIFITRYDRKIVIYLKNGKISFWNSIKEIKKVLTENFFCSHKGYIINVDFVNELIPYGAKTYQVVFSNSNETALMTTEKAKLFREKYCMRL